MDKFHNFIHPSGWIKIHIFIVNSSREIANQKNLREKICISFSELTVTASEGKFSLGCRFFLVKKMSINDPLSSNATTQLTQHLGGIYVVTHVGFLMTCEWIFLLSIVTEAKPMWDLLRNYLWRWCAYRNNVTIPRLSSINKQLINWYYFSSKVWIAKTFFFILIKLFLIKNLKCYAYVLFSCHTVLY